jgi:hypothetical protein
MARARAICVSVSSVSRRGWVEVECPVGIVKRGAHRGGREVCGKGQ